MSTQRFRWAGSWVIVALIASSVIPLLAPTIPPLADLPGHIGRYRIQLDLDQSPHLGQWFAFEWSIIGNLGVDLLVQLLGQFVNLELAAKLVVISIPPTTAAGFLWIAREAHGRVPATALLAIPLVYNYPFLFGFVNYCLAMAWAMVAFALWLCLGRLCRWTIRALLFAGIGPILWLMHVYGWGALGLMCFATEIYRAAPASGGGWHLRAWIYSGIKAFLRCTPLMIPLVFMLIWREDTDSATGGWFDLVYKAKWAVGVFRDRWLAFDLASAAVIYGALALGFLNRQALRYQPMLASAAAALWLAFILLPHDLFGSSFAAVRLLPYSVALSLLALGPGPGWSPHFTKYAVVVGVAFIIVRLSGLTASSAAYARSFTSELGALHHIPVGARIAVFTESPCGRQWQHPRLAKLPGIAIARKHAFTNDQAALAGAQGLRVTYKEAAPFLREPSSQVAHGVCPGLPLRTLNQSLRILPWRAFDYLWLINVPERYWPRRDNRLEVIWRKEGSVLFRIKSEARPRLYSHSGEVP